MTTNTAATSLGVQVDSSHYTTSRYFHPGRFAAYAYQIKEILNSGAKKVLEIGPGSGVVTYSLRQAGIHVDTLDHDPALQPDFVASVMNMPFAPNSYDAVMCCQVLEHLPWEHFRTAMQGISSVAKNTIVLSLPHVSAHVCAEIRWPQIGHWRLSIDLPIRNTPMSFNGEHYWVIGRGVSEKDILSVFDAMNLRLRSSYRVPEYRAHHFFCLSHSI